MRALLSLAAICLPVCSVLADDKLLSIDEKSSLIVIGQDANPQALRVDEKTEILQNGVKVSLGELQPGITVRVRNADNQTAARIEAIGVIKKAATPPAKPVAPPKMRSITLRMKLDGINTIHFDGNGVWLEHDAAGKPTNFLLNAREWVPQWQGEKTAPFTQFDPPLAPLGQTRPLLKQLSGRNKAAFIKGTIKGDFAVKIEDHQSGPDIYEIRLSW